MPPYKKTRHSTRSSIPISKGQTSTRNDPNVAATTTHEFSDYEVLRQQKILRNQEKLRSLGLLSSKEVKSIQQQQQRTTSKITTSGCGSSSVQLTTLTPNVPHQQQRQSLRLRGINPFPTGKKNVSSRNNVLVDVTNGAAIRTTTATTTIATGHNAATTNNKTTTKEHCKMRLRTMSIPQLQQRIRTIERQRGRYCMAKLYMMHECCIEEEGLQELAQQAYQAIERLTNSGL